MISHHFHYFTIRQFAIFLQEHLHNAVISEIFSQNKDELILEFFYQESTKYLIINCNPEFPFYYFSHDYKRAAKNTASLFHRIENHRVLNVQIIDGERVILIELENKFRLILKLFGKQSNVLLQQKNEILEIFRHSLERDWNFQIQQTEYNNEFWENLAKNGTNFETFWKIPFWDATIRSDIEKDLQQQVPLNDILGKWIAIQYRPLFYLSSKPLSFSILPLENAQTFENVNEALQQFVKTYYTVELFEARKNTVLKNLAQKISKIEKKINSFETSIKKIEESRSCEEIGHIIMANLHLKIQGQEKWIFDDFYTNEKIEISLKKDLNLQQNASLYYQKHKRRQLEKKHLNQQIEQLLGELERLNLKYESLLKVEKHRELEKWLKPNPEYEEQKQLQALPYRTFEIQGYSIFVGKDAKSNDKLTLHYAHKEDLWFHAKDVAGSHVVLKTQRKKDIPKEVIEAAAQLAAYYSKNRNNSFVPVIITPKKFVRKPKGFPPGKVMVEMEKVIFVTPKSYDEIL